MAATRPDSEIERSAIAKMSWRILPLLGFGYMIAYIDRSNISFAATQMNQDLGFSATIYGIGAGMFLAQIYLAVDSGVSPLRI
jgi:MFS transporter, ACS family, tartrate transporter